MVCGRKSGRKWLLVRKAGKKFQRFRGEGGGRAERAQRRGRGPKAPGPSFGLAGQGPAKRRRPVRKGRCASPPKRLPSSPLFIGISPGFFCHWGRSALPPCVPQGQRPAHRQGEAVGCAALRPRKAGSPGRTRGGGGVWRPGGQRPPGQPNQRAGLGPALLGRFAPCRRPPGRSCFHQPQNGGKKPGHSFHLTPPRPSHPKKVVAIASRCKGVYNRVGEGSAPFPERIWGRNERGPGKKFLPGPEWM